MYVHPTKLKVHPRRNNCRNKNKKSRLQTNKPASQAANNQFGWPVEANDCACATARRQLTTAINFSYALSFAFVFAFWLCCCASLLVGWLLAVCSFHIAALANSTHLCGRAHTQTTRLHIDKFYFHLKRVFHMQANVTTIVRKNKTQRNNKSNEMKKCKQQQNPEALRWTVSDSLKQKAKSKRWSKNT